MTARNTLARLRSRVGCGMFAAAAAALLCAMITPAYSSGGTQPPWHIESFCHRGAPAAHRCLVRARQGIVVSTLAELASAPRVSWSNGVAVLASGADKASRQLRFFLPPQKLSAPFMQVRAYDVARQRVAFYNEGQLHVRAMFGEGADGHHDLAVLVLPYHIVTDTLRVSFEGPWLHASWRDRDGHAQERTLPAKS